jgi:hypothetical protein
MHVYRETTAHALHVYNETTAHALHEHNHTTAHAQKHENSNADNRRHELTAQKNPGHLWLRKGDPIVHS